MRLFAISTTALLAATTLAALAPTTSAVGWCSELLNDVKNDDCQHLICWGRSTSTYNGVKYERCQFSEEDIPDPCRWNCRLDELLP